MLGSIAGRHICILKLCNIRWNSYYITTPIFYVNASPHIGHVHTLFLADALNIYRRLKDNSDKTIFSTGTDEHGFKIQAAAEVNKMTSLEFCDLNAAKFAKLFSNYETTVTDFIRTTEERHKSAVQSLWSQLDARGFIYKSTYSGWYCTSDETFVPESQITTKILNDSTVHFDQNYNQVVWSSEENYMFRLSLVEDEIGRWLATKRPIVPEKFNNMILTSLNKNRIGDISISRPKSRLQWGIEVPGDSSQTIYVWLDALTSYLTVVGYPCNETRLKRWPIDCQVLGKDIIKFHAIYWPAFLLALSLPLPKKLICHSHWTVDSVKMSKSKGNVVDPWCENQILTPDGLRYYLLRASTNHSDNDYSRLQAFRRVNAELADTYGNLMSRCCGRNVNPDQVIPKSLIQTGDLSAIQNLTNELNRTIAACELHFDSADFYQGIDQIMTVLRASNKLYEDTKPWKLIKDVPSCRESFAKHNNIQAMAFETLRICSILLTPIIPNIARKALSYMNVGQQSWRDARIKLDTEDLRYDPLPTNPNFILFKRLKQ